MRQRGEIFEPHPPTRRENLCLAIVAKMLGLNHHGGALRIQSSLAQKVGDLRGETLLDLRPASEDLDQARHLADAEDASLRNVADVRHPVERQEMMLTHTVKGDVFDDHHLMMVLVVESH